MTVSSGPYVVIVEIWWRHLIVDVVGRNRVARCSKIRINSSSMPGLGAPGAGRTWETLMTLCFALGEVGSKSMRTTLGLLSQTSVIV